MRVGWRFLLHAIAVFATVAVLAVSSASDCALAATTTETVRPLSAAQNDKRENFTVANDGLIMQQAIARARATLPDFLQRAERPRRGMSDFSVKYGLNTAKGIEYVWASVIKRVGQRVLATIDVDVRWSDEVKEGDPVFVEIHDIIDWMYLDRDRLIGNTTLCALDAMSPSEERRALRERMRLDCTWITPAKSATP